jgi:tetratricopeptide (TPR) repeat protein
VVARDRVCEIYAGRLWGSGYVVAGPLVLTAAHVGGDVGATVRLRLLGAGADLFDGRVVWSSHTETLDVALVEITSPGHAMGDLPPVRWGRLVTARAGVACEAAGFPDAKLVRGPDGQIVMRDVEHLSGEISPLTGAKARQLDVSMRSAAPEPTAPSQPSPWGGMSGAALFCGPLLTGVIRRDPVGFGSRRLTAVQVAEFVGDDEFRRLVGAVAGRPPVAEPVELADLQARTWPVTSPASLLRADVEAVEFHGRDDLLRRLRDWCSAAGGLSARLLTGPGGVGKTRLAAQFARSVAEAGWAVLHLAEDPADTRLTDAYRALDGVAMPLLIVVDYAETRRHQLHHLGNYLPDGQGGPVRLLLVARTAGDWLREFAAASAGLAFLSPSATPQIEVAQLADTVAGRRDAFARAVAGLAVRLPQVAGQAGRDWARLASEVREPDLTQPRYGSILAIQMAALAELLQTGHGAAPAAAPEEVLLAHEERYWNRLARSRSADLPDGDRLRRWAVTTATVCTAATEDEAIATVRQTPGLADQPDALHRATARWLHDLYERQHQYWASLQPDRLAEHLVGAVLAEQPHLLDKSLPAATASQAHHAFTVLARAAADHTQLSDTIGRLVTTHPALAPAAARVATETEHPQPLTSALDALLAGGGLDRQLLHALADAIPLYTHVHQVRAVQIAAALVEAYRDETRDHGARRLGHRRPRAVSLELAESLSYLGSRLSGLGRQEEALTANNEARQMYEALDAADPGAYEPDIVAQLGVHAVDLNDLGRHKEALVVADEAVRRQRRLVALAATGPEALQPYYRAHPGGFITDFVQPGRLGAVPPEMLETSLGAHLIALTAVRSSLGLPEPALGSAQEAVRLLRDQATRYPHSSQPLLASSLIIASTLLQELGRNQEAVDAAREAAAIYRRLAEARPDAFLDAQASASANLGAMLSGVGRREEAMDSAQEAVSTYRRLAEDLPDRYRPELAGALNSLTLAQSNMGRHGDAVISGQEAVAIHRQLAETAAGRFAPDPAVVLNNLALAYSALGRPAEALDSAQEAVTIYRRLAQSAPDEYQPELAGTLSYVAACLLTLNRPAEALEAVQEALAIVRRPPRAAGASWDDRLADSLSVLSNVLAELGRDRDARAALQEAAAVYRRLARADSGFEPELGETLISLAEMLATHGADADAVPIAREAVALYRRLVERGASWEPDLATALDRLGQQLTAVDRDVDAVAVQAEAVEIVRRLAADDPDRFEPDLAEMLDRLGVTLFVTDRTADGLASIREGLAIRRRLAHDRPEAHLPAVAESLGSLRLALEVLGQLADAQTAAQEALAIWQDLARVDPATHESDVAETLNSLADLHLQRDDIAQAEYLARQALEIWRRLVDQQDPSAPQGLAEALTVLLQALLASEDDRSRESSAVARLAVAAYGQLADTDPDTFEPRLAQSLSSLALTLLSERTDDGVAAAREAVSVYRRWRKVDPARTDTDVIGMLAILSAQLAQLGWSDAALAAVEEAVTPFRQLTGEDPTTHEDDLAELLTVQARALSASGRRKEAVRPAEEAVALRRRRMSKADGPDTESKLLESLACLRGIHSGLARREHVLVAATEEVAVCRQLARRDPNATELLAGCLDRLSATLSTSGRLAEAAAAASESESLSWQVVLAESLPDEDPAHLSQPGRATSAGGEHEDQRGPIAPGGT